MKPSTPELADVLAENARLKADLAAVRALLEQVKDNLYRALGGTRYDSSWIRPLQISMKERQELYQNITVAIDQALAPPHPGQRYVEAMELLRTIVDNAELQPDPRMGRCTDCYFVPLDDIEEAKRLVEGES